MPESIGTRTKSFPSNGRQDQGSDTRSHTRDVDMSKRYAGNLTFTSADGRVTAANGAFSNFALNDPVLADGTNLNNGYFQVSGVDAVNGAYLVLTPPPKDEGPVAGVVRTA